MLTHVNVRSDTPVYDQIENEVKFAIASGELKADDKIPAVQELAKRLGVNPNTVAKAYRDLEVMGLIYTRRGMGCFINTGVQAKCRARCRTMIIGKLFEITQEAKAAGMGKTDLNAILSTSFALDSSPYGEVPAKILARPKGKK